MGLTAKASKKRVTFFQNLKKIKIDVYKRFFFVFFWGGDKNYIFNVLKYFLLTFITSMEITKKGSVIWMSAVRFLRWNVRRRAFPVRYDALRRTT